MHAPAPVEPDSIRDTLNALVAFVVPGPDPYSLAQGVSTPEPGGLDAGITDALIETLNRSRPFPVARLVAGVLMDAAKRINPGAEGPFVSPFARLSYADKLKVFELIEGIEPLKPAAGLLPIVVARLVYGEADAVDPATGTLRHRPLGWTLTGFDGPAAGHAEFKGYLGDDERVAG